MRKTSKKTTVFLGVLPGSALRGRALGGEPPDSLLQIDRVRCCALRCAHALAQETHEAALAHATQAWQGW